MLGLAAAAAALAADMRLAPATGNPFAAHPAPLREGRRLLAEGRVGDASLAFEAAVQVFTLGKDQHVSRCKTSEAELCSPPGRHSGIGM